MSADLQKVRVDENFSHTSDVLVGGQVSSQLVSPRSCSTQIKRMFCVSDGRAGSSDAGLNGEGVDRQDNDVLGLNG